jgi:hypothetical protein
VSIKTLVFAILFGLASTSVSLAEADYTQQEQYNPQRDPDVERGYKENQDYNRDRQNEEERTQRGEAPWSVDVSGQDSSAGKRDK